jgi:hypothetical protein
VSGIEGPILEWQGRGAKPKLGAEFNVGSDPLNKNSLVVSGEELMNKQFVVEKYGKVIIASLHHPTDAP